MFMRHVKTYRCEAHSAKQVCLSARPNIQLHAAFKLRRTVGMEALNAEPLYVLTGRMWPPSVRAGPSQNARVAPHTRGM